MFSIFLLSKVTGMFFNIQPGWKRRPLRNDESSCSGDAATTEARSWGSRVLISCCCCFLSICFKVSGTSWYVGMCREIYKSFGHLGSWEFFFRLFLPRWWEMVSINHYEVATCGSSVLSVKCTSSLRPNHIPKTMVPRNGCLIYLGIFWDWPYFGLFLELSPTATTSPNIMVS